MNKDRLLQLADALETGIPGVGFDMNEWYDKTDCGTVCCVAGHAAVMAGEDVFVPTDAAVFAREWLDLTMSESRRLFMPDKDGLAEDLGTGVWGKAYNYVTPVMAAAVVRHLAETGVVDWTVARPMMVGEGL